MVESFDGGRAYAMARSAPANVAKGHGDGAKVFIETLEG
jgi:hypothetical protein